MAVVLAATMASLAWPVWAQSPVKVEGAWARPTVQGQMGGGGFLKITGGPAADRLLSGSAPVSQVVELHTMNMEGDVMRMRQVQAIDVPAGGTVELKPGGMHLMFIGLKQPLKAGDTFPLTLRFEKAGEVKVDVQITARPPAGAAAGGHGGHGNHGGHKH
jgi:copper(I)-binding protein